jgi:glycosyltransferase involved in cell wall biosynthesis
MSGLAAMIIAERGGPDLDRAIRSVSFADEIVVVASAPLEVPGARVVVRPWRGFAEARRDAIREAREAWVLFIDTDEEATPDLGAEVRDLLRVEPACAGYRIPRHGFFLGRWIRHGAWGRDRILRLVRRSAARVTERRVHETVEVDGPVGDLRGVLLHHSQPDLDSVVRRMGRYAELAARDLADARRAAGRGIGAWEVALRPAGDFVRDYILRLGLLDGAAGLLLATFGAASTMAKYHEARRILRDDA